MAVHLITVFHNS